MGIPRHYKFDPTNRNRRRHLKDVIKREINNSSLIGDKKNFLRGYILSVMQEYAELWEARPTKKNKNES